MTETQLLTVIIMESRQVMHRSVEVPQRLKPADVAVLARTLDEVIRSHEGDPSGVDPEAVAGAGALLPSLKALVAALCRALRQEEEYVLTGASHILEQPEFRSVDKVEPIIRLLEQRKSAFEVLHSLLAGSSMKVIIGAENPRVEMQECSLVAARYRAGSRMSGWIGILGPTRMPYERALPTVDLAARALSRALTRLSG